LVAAAKALGLTTAEADVESAAKALTSARVDVVIVLQTGLLLSVGRQIAELAQANGLSRTRVGRRSDQLRRRFALVLPSRGLFRRQDSARHRPGELPVGFPTKMTLSINLSTAKVLHITVPPRLLGLADEVIE